MDTCPDYLRGRQMCNWFAPALKRRGKDGFPERAGSRPGRCLWGGPVSTLVGEPAVAPGDGGHQLSAVSY